MTPFIEIIGFSIGAICKGVLVPIVQRRPIGGVNEEFKRQPAVLLEKSLFITDLPFFLNPRMIIPTPKFVSISTSKWYFHVFKSILNYK